MYSLPIIIRKQNVRFLQGFNLSRTPRVIEECSRSNSSTFSFYAGTIVIQILQLQMYLVQYNCS